MQKILGLFVRDENHRATDEVTPGCEWVQAGEGIATEKFDGSACLVHENTLYRRRRHKVEHGAAPPGWIHWSFDPRITSGHGWVPVGSDPEARCHLEALDECCRNLAAGTYELVGPKVQSNPYNLVRHYLWRHGDVIHSHIDPLFRRDFEGLRTWLHMNYLEGIVWHHPDGRMVKLKRRDFGFPWPVATR